MFDDRLAFCLRSGPHAVFERAADAPKHENTRLALGPPKHENTETRTRPWGQITKTRKHGPPGIGQNTKTQKHENVKSASRWAVVSELARPICERLLGRGKSPITSGPRSFIPAISNELEVSWNAHSGLVQDRVWVGFPSLCALCLSPVPSF